MKGERRHELQTNSLSQFLTDLPLYLRFHANKFLLGFIVLCAIFLLVRYRMSAAQQAREAAHTSIGSALVGIEQLKRVDQTQATDMGRLQERKKIADQIRAAIDQILNTTSDSSDTVLRADALVAKGDLYWTIANLPPLDSAATQPAASGMPSATDALQTAEDSYDQVLKNYDSQKIPKASALFGLAAIEENRGNWDKATALYNTILADSALSGLFREIATQRISIIPQIQKPVYLGSYSSTQPATQAATEPATAPATNAAQ
ncbi:MAG TPA: hypothetical protein VHD56_17290 [Tepidisphaeraceae bacterium]|nr:hypothetical protein [Tepidisphaeraceae bacterium]